MKNNFFRSSNWEKSLLKLSFVICHNINVALLWLILKWNTILKDFFLLDSVHYHYDVITSLKSDWFNLKILMSGWNLKLTSSCVSFTIYQQCHRDIASDVTPTSLQCHNVHWVPNGGTWYFIRYPPPGPDWSLLKTVAMSNVFFNNQQQVFECIWCVSR